MGSYRPSSAVNRLKLIYNSMRMQTRNIIQETLLRSTLILSIVSILVSCQLTPSPAVNEEPAVSTDPAPPLPEMFQTDLLNPIDTPHTYVEETCRYLRNKWNPLNAKPGTVVMVILFKNINRGTADLPDSISVIEFFALMDQLAAQGFEAINSDQLQAFLERNVVIPPRSVLLIQDGNHTADYYDQNFRDYFEVWGWGVTNGWVSERDMDAALLAENIALENEGFVDHQARGISPNTVLTDDTAKTIIARELQGSQTGFANQFAKTPTVIIWPNGGFGIRPVEAARQLRFKLGFTSNSRGPIMYNWVPLADTVDPQRPSLLPEGNIGDPLMTLPVYSPNEVINILDTVRAIGKASGEHADLHKNAEFMYYENVCEEEYGPMPTP
jgi:hypothetical protein